MTTTRKPAAPVSKVLDSITDSDALSILKLLAERDDKLVDVIDATARELLGQVDAESLCTFRWSWNCWTRRKCGTDLVR